MTDDEIRALGKINCTQAAEILGMPVNHLRVALEHKKLPIGDCIRGKGGRRSIHINTEALIAYRNGDLDPDIKIRLEAAEKRIAELERVCKVFELARELGEITINFKGDTNGKSA